VMARAANAPYFWTFFAWRRGSRKPAEVKAVFRVGRTAANQASPTLSHALRCVWAFLSALHGIPPSGVRARCRRRKMPQISFASADSQNFPDMSAMPVPALSWPCSERICRFDWPCGSAGQAHGWPLGGSLDAATIGC